MATLFQASSAYWRGDKDRESLQRVYGISYPDQKRLKVLIIFSILEAILVLPTRVIKAIKWFY